MKCKKLLFPINKMAAIVTSTGTHFQPKIKQNPHDERELIPEIRKDWPSKKTFNLTDLTCGWLTVIGLSAEKNDRWVCRCVCGKYVFRTAKSLRREKNIIDKCIHCNKLDYLRQKNSHVKTF